MAEKAHTFIYKRADGEGTNICVQVACLLLMGAMYSCYLCRTFALMFSASAADFKLMGYVEGEISLPIGGNAAPFYIELISDIDS